MDLSIPLRTALTSRHRPPRGDNILFGLLQLGLPLDEALKLALEHQEDNQQFAVPHATEGSISIPAAGDADDGSEEEDDGL